MPEIPIWHIDAFTDRPFAGNPAAVCLLHDEPDGVWMQAVAAEMNLSETAFVRPLADGFELRWFTPTVEVDLCGHATLASAHALWSARRSMERRVQLDEPIRFHTRSGLLTATQRNPLIELDFPSAPPQECPPPVGLLPALGNPEAEFVGKTGYNGVLVVTSGDAVRSMRPDFDALARLSLHGAIVTAQSDTPGYDFISRYFAPAAGINEDPVTGSAHCSLAPYWAARLQKRELIGYQASARGGIVHARLHGERVILGGQAVTVLRGELG